MKNEIEFVEEGHYYLNDGVLIPSVSELIRFRFPEAYAGIPDKILKKKADYGTKVHDYIERFINKEFTLEEVQKKNIDPNIKIAVEQFEKLRKKCCFYIKDMEEIVSYKGKYAGKYDLLTDDDLIIDIKTTSEIHDEWLKYQLGLYYLAAGIKQEYGYVIWLPKGKAGQVKQISVAPHEECIKLLKEYGRDVSSRQ